ncbi:dephospho-CoA kinase [Corynebacterium sp. 153RC1]|uniref:dephospho-CoA kinase n=1 Tax=unclassified Corynebacterium TaxID=2624378 RepID=UPI00211BC0EB|nr:MULTISPECIES: dephospho-CoA kinase [unclassified Corynebacterium]MCQ9353180.1 dephospho-CoA kinase [Corynebacterium sp. 209RC1]MCQ9353881.1 dephospho-CoA kinase [Corynebacterium sp. 1222RC1]MCQ9356912.1 dephospho-CoA kinase [Corynebacterium sp. 122RC1]MCQ9359756.1 dephospho-CoA kinase [Corynebacterium sp. 142RC1]MCQ9361380.1 dephospho-CoA kinase [Corynebacterium sp. 153RC1]
MTVLGITGGIGSGKSTVTKALAQRGALVVDADQVARLVMEPGHPVLAKVAEVFGHDILHPDGSLDRALLAQRAFASTEQTARLNAITHPAIAELISEELRKHNAAAAADKAVPAVVLDHPLLIESGAIALVDKVAVVVVDVEERIRRLGQFRGISEQDARARIAQQLSDEERLQHADAVIDNNGSVEDLEPQVEALWNEVFGRVS